MTGMQGSGLLRGGVPRVQPYSATGSCWPDGRLWREQLSVQTCCNRHLLSLTLGRHEVQSHTTLLCCQDYD